jgi:hypothetical protein
MSVLKRIAHGRGRRDEVPNLELARDLAARRDRKRIREIAANLENANSSIQSDCIKVLYEVGCIEPALIAPYAENFLGLLKSRNNRLVWGGMTALAAVANLKPEIILANRADIERAMKMGSVITVDNAVLALARAAARDTKYRKALFPSVINHLSTCRPKDVPQHSEKALEAVDSSNKARFIRVLRDRLPDLSGAAARRVTSVIRRAELL